MKNHAPPILEALKSRNGARDHDFSIFEAPKSRPGERTWEVTQFFPFQGQWSEEEYLALPTNHLVELSNGCLETLPMPTDSHQAIVAQLYEELKAFVTKHAPGIVRFSPLPVKLWPRQFREPDVLYMREENKGRIDRYWNGADLVMEIVSESNADHDRNTKRIEYAKAGIPEYWIVDTLEKKILVYTLSRKKYRLHGEFGAGEQATSKLLPGFGVDVDAVMKLVEE